MRSKYKEKKEKKEKEILMEKTIKIEDMKLSRSKSPGSIMNKLDLLTKFNRLLFEKGKKRDNSAVNELNIRRVNPTNLNTKNITKEKKENINIRGHNTNNHRFKIIRHSSYSKFDNEESLNNSSKKNVIKLDKEKDEIKKKRLFHKKDKKDKIKKTIDNTEEKNKEKENISHNNGSKTDIPPPSLNYIKKQPEKYMKGIKGNNGLNKKISSNKKINANNKDNNIIIMSNIEDFDKPKEKKENKDINEIIIDYKTNIKDLKNYNSKENLNLDFHKNKSNENIKAAKDENQNQFEITSSNRLLKKMQAFKNDDIILNENDANNIYTHIKRSPVLEKKVILGKPRQTFQFLVHQAYKNRELSNSFNKYYQSGARSREGSKDKNIKKEDINEQKFNSRNKFFCLMKSPKNIKNRSVTNLINIKNKKTELKEYEDKKTEKRNNIKTINLNDNISNTNCTSSENLPTIKSIKITNNNNPKYSNNNNTNNIKVVEDKKRIYSKLCNYSNNTIRKKNVIDINDNSSSFGSSQSTDSNTCNIEFEIFIILDEKMKIIMNRINNYQLCVNECYNYIQYYFSNQFYHKILNFFFNKNNKFDISCYIKIETLCFFLCYDISFSPSFNQAAILLKTMINIIHTNYILIIYFIVNLLKKNYSNNNSLKKIILMIENEPSITQIKKQEMNEYNISKIISNNLKNLNNYYKMIIDNIYGKYNIIKDDNYKFPNCNKYIELIKSKSNQYKLINIISSFFYDAYRKLNNYDFIELQKFFYLFLNQNNNQKKIGNNNIQKMPINNNNKIIYYLPKIKKCYKYSLVLDLDETLISFQKNYNTYDIKNFIKDIKTKLILRPGLFEFLHNMKQLYELILFSSGTSDYVDPIVKLIEQNENYFEFVLYRQHISYDERGEYFKNLNLLNRNIKNIIIIDDMEKNFRLHKENGICIKPFYGDYQKNMNILNLLGQLLMKIRIDADETGDIRISLNKEKKNVIYSKVAINTNG